MAVSLSDLTTGALSLSNLLLVTPDQDLGYQPQNPPQSNGEPSTAQSPPTFVFNYEGEQTVTLESDITDHFVEDNTAIQDQIALRPEVVTTHGFIGDLNNVTPKALALLKKAADKLTVVNAYVPVVSETALIAYNEAFFAYQTAQTAVQSAVSAWSSITGTPSAPIQTKQQIAFAQWYGYWKNRTLFTVQTPWAVFKNMAIKSLRAIQDETTRVITDFDVQFKMIRTAKTAITTGITPILQGRAAFQMQAPTDLGIQTPVPSISVSQGLTKMGVAP